MGRRKAGQRLDKPHAGAARAESRAARRLVALSVLARSLLGNRRRRLYTTIAAHLAAARAAHNFSSTTMALRLAAGRPLGAAVRSAACPRSAAAVRNFTATALRVKEVAAQNSDKPNMRVRVQLALCA